MTRWVRIARGSVWHACATVLLHESVITVCGRYLDARGGTFSDHQPVEDECRLCRRALDGGKQ